MMNASRKSGLVLSVLGFLPLLFAGCATYQPVPRPVPQLSILSSNLTERNIQKFLKQRVKVDFPAVLAIAKVEDPGLDPNVSEDTDEGRQFTLQQLQSTEADGWQQLRKVQGRNFNTVIRRIQYIRPGMLTGRPTLSKLRAAAARLHAPLLLVYTQEDRFNQGYNDAAAAYWTGVGLLFVPGNSLGYHSVAQAALVDVDTNVVLATAESQARREDKVPIIVVDSTRDKMMDETRAEAIAGLQKNFAKALSEIER